MKKKISSCLFYFISILFILVYLFSELTPNFHLSEFGRLFLLGCSCLFLYFGGLLLSKYKNTNKPMKINLWIFFILYLLLFITLTLFDPVWGRNGIFIVNWSKELFNNYINTSLNLIPFATIYEYIKDFNTLISTNTIFYNLIGNFICLMPLGFFLPLLFKKQNNTKIFLLTSTIFVITIELLQFLTLSGSCDIDDIILNVSGAFIMYKLLKLDTLQNLIKNIFLLENNKIDKNKLFKILGLFIIIIIILFMIIAFRKKLYNKNLEAHNAKYNYDLKIVDETDNCNEALEEFYEDELYKYYFSCIKSNQVYVIINNSEKYLVKEILNNNPTDYYITIDRLEHAGLDFIKKEKYNKIILEYDEGNYYNTHIFDEEILDIKSRIVSNGKIVSASLYLIPKKAGKTNLEIKIKTYETDKQIDIIKYLIEIDENLNVKYSKITN